MNPFLTADREPDWDRIRANLELDNVENGIPPAEAAETIAEMKSEWAATGQIVGWTVPDPNAAVATATCPLWCLCDEDHDRLW